MSSAQPVLDGKRVWITRPKHQQANLQSLLLQQGAELICQPGLSLEPLSSDYDAKIKSRILDLDVYQHLIFISTNAVDFGMPWVDQYWPQMPSYQHYYAIGKSTQQALAKWDVDALSSELVMNSEALLELESLRDLHGQRCLIMRGLGGREYLAEQLRARGAQVDYCETYQRQLPKFNLEELTQELAQAKVHYLLINSVDTLTNILTMVPQSLLAKVQRAVVIVPSVRVVQACQLQGFKQVLQATNASDQAMLECLLAASKSGQ